MTGYNTPDLSHEAVSRLVTAATKVVESYWNDTDGVISGIYDLEIALSFIAKGNRE